MTATGPVRRPAASGSPAAGTVLSPATGGSGWAAGLGPADHEGGLCRQEAGAPRTSVGAGGNYYHNSLKALARMNRWMTKMASARPRRAAK